MRNDTHSNLLGHSVEPGRLKLINNQEDTDDAAAYYPYQPAETTLVVDNADHTKTTMAVFVAVSIACATAAVATGSYAAWLARQQSARLALTDVNDILRSCQAKMRQLEADVERLPGRQA